MVDEYFWELECRQKENPEDLFLKMRLIRSYVRSARLADALPLCSEVLDVCKFDSEEYDFVRNILVSHGVDLDQLYVNLGVRNGVYVWRLNGRGERVVGLYFDSYYFNILAVIVNGPCRLVSVNFSHGK